MEQGCGLDRAMAGEMEGDQASVGLGGGTDCGRQRGTRSLPCGRKCFVGQIHYTECGTVTQLRWPRAALGAAGSSHFDAFACEVYRKSFGDIR